LAGSNRFASIPVDELFVEQFRQRSAEESARTSPPAGFPHLPDLPLGRYTDDAFHQLELTHLWGASWVYAAHRSEFDSTGSYRVVDVAGTQVVLTCAEDGEIRAFVNACRHRGAPVAQGSMGDVRLLICPYHSWSYDLKGRLVRVPEERDFPGLCKEDRALVPVRCESFGGFWFVNLNVAAPPLAESLGTVAQLLAPVANAPWQVLHRTVDYVGCNWKVLAEGFLEVYHARTVHQKTIAPTLDTAGTVISLFDNGHQSMISPVHAGTRTDGRDSLPMFEGVPPLMRESLNPAFGIFPNLISPLDARGFPFLVFWPEGVRRTRLETTWFAPSWGNGDVPGRDIWDKRLTRFAHIMQEDYSNLEPIQRSMERAAHGGQVINYQERRIWHVHSWIDRTIGPERIAPHLRVPGANLLDDWVEV
jgi:phenylpropionate dioxygenase-like ring-hydroxylating dioxygenase large terminal subunit